MAPKRTLMIVSLAGLTLSSFAPSAIAQTPTDPSPTPPAASAPDAAPPTLAPPDAPGPAAPTAPAAGPAPLEPSTQAPLGAPPPPSSPPPPPSYPPPSEPPPPPTYPPLGQPEPQIRRGHWNPWAHPYPEAYDHRGFYLRLSLGLGAAGLSGSNHEAPDIKRVSLSGADLGFSFAAGGAIADNLILDADFFGSRLFDPYIRKDGKRYGYASDVGDEIGVGEVLQFTGFGPGATYYFMPINLYVAASAGIGSVQFENKHGDRSSSDLGFAGNLMVGKEWWAAPQWGIGVAVQGMLILVHDDVLGPVAGFVTNVMFSATYN